MPIFSNKGRWRGSISIPQALVHCISSFEHNCTPSGKKRVTGVQVVTASEVQSISVGGRPFQVPQGTSETQDPVTSYTCNA